MSAQSFRNSIHFGDASKCRDFLLSKGVELPEGMTDQLPAVAFHGWFSEENIAQWDRAATEEELLEKSKEAWDEWMKTPLPVQQQQNLKEWCGKNKGCLAMRKDDAEYMRITNPAIIQFVMEKLDEKREEVIKARFNQLKPKSKSKATGQRAVKRDKTQFDCVFTNTEENPHGKEFDYYLPTDEGRTMVKDGKIQVGKGKDGMDKKPQTYKAVRKSTPFLLDGACKCGVTWDRASGSKKLSDDSIKGSFVMGCAGDRVSGTDYCSKHQDKGKSGNIFKTTYKSGKYKGVTHAQVLFIMNGEGGCVLEDDGEWIEGECGDKWMDEVVIGA
tara:strand:+ start:7097 stop:8083 length:987 start_codon:yes stop_codon:yes gene_type:complete